MSAMQKHLDAIAAGSVTATNVIGLRKAANHVARLRAGWSGNRSSATQAEVDAAFDALAKYEPVVRGDLHASGVRLLTNKRWAKRFDAAQTDVIRTLHGFRLVRFDLIDAAHVTPVYRACGETGSFLFRNIPWQTVSFRPDLQSGPTVLA